MMQVVTGIIYIRMT